MEKFEIRAYIKGRAIQKVSPSVILSELQQIYGDNAPVYSTVVKWTAFYRDGGDSLFDAPRCGRPITTVTAANIERVRQFLEDDPHATYNEIEAELFINQCSLHEIITGKLKMKKMTSRWIPHDLSEKNREERVSACRENLKLFLNGPLRLCDVFTGDESWFYMRHIEKKSDNVSWVKDGEKPLTVVRRGRYEPKFMYSVFFKTTGLVHLHVMEKVVLSLQNPI